MGNNAITLNVRDFPFLHPAHLVLPALACPISAGDSATPSGMALSSEVTSRLETPLSARFNG